MRINLMYYEITPKKLREVLQGIDDNAKLSIHKIDNRGDIAIDISYSDYHTNKLGIKYPRYYNGR